jgi:hypothetical protein
MKIQWQNIITFTVLIVLLIVWARHGNQVTAFLANIKNIGPGHTSDEQTQGVIGLAFLCATFIAAFRILLKNKNN